MCVQESPGQEEPGSSKHRDSDQLDQVPPCHHCVENCLNTFDDDYHSQESLDHSSRQLQAEPSGASPSA